MSRVASEVTALRSRLRAIVFVIGAIVLLVVACSSGDSAMNDDSEPGPSPSSGLSDAGDAEATPEDTEPLESSSPDTSVELALAPVVVPELAGDDEPLPFDTEVRVGVLDNGLTYYIRANDSPGGRAELRLAVDAGSTVEDDDQSGVAHFLEHMLFNGTERYPANELIAVLESFGSEFGPDVNAYTSFDETVYELSVATDDQSQLNEAIDVLREWAANATIDPDEVVAERGVVLEEWRLRGQGVGGRINDVYEETLTADSDYEGRSPIGNPAAIEAMTADVLRRFYEDWYRPDLMAVVVVGEIDPDDVEDLVTERFSDLENPAATRPPDNVVVPDATMFEYSTLEDPELPTAYIELIYPGPAAPVETIGDRRRSIAYALAGEIISGRFDDDVSRGEAPFLTAYTSVTPLARDLDTPGLLAEGPSDVLGESFELLLEEIERVRRDGFTEDEVLRAVEAARAGLEQSFAGRETAQDTDYARDYVEHFVGDTPTLGWDDLLSIESRLLDEMNPEYVRAVYLNTIAGRAPQVVVVGPEAEADSLPSEQDVLLAFEAVGSRSVDPRVDESRVVDSLMPRPDSVDAVDEGEISELEATRLDYPNGVTVLLKHTDIAENAFGIGGLNPGGLSLLSQDQLAAAFLLPQVVSSSGVGDVDQVQLDRFLADRVAFVEFSLDETAERISAGGSVDDAEAVLQLVNQYLEDPRVQQSALETAIAELEPFAADPGALPFLAASAELVDARYGGDPRYRLLPTVDDLDRLTTASMEEVHAASLGDATGTVYAIVGDFDVDEMADLASRYLGSLTADGQPDVFVDAQPGPPESIIDRTVAVGQDPQGATTMLITAELGLTTKEAIELQVLENVVATRLRDRLREALGATYSPSVVMSATSEPDELVETIVQVSGDPEGLDVIVDEIVELIEDLRTGGLTDAEVATAREQVRRDFELVSNGFWIDQLLLAATQPDKDVFTVAERVATAMAVSRADLNSLIDVVLLDDQYIVVSQVPEI
ncbi:MAG: M16 family metallopeptidase [Acidimicrobiales bacterium]